jgi:hypothetical protein
MKMSKFGWPIGLLRLKSALLTIACFAAMAVGSVSSALATDIRLTGTVSYQTSGANLNMTAGAVENHTIGGTSGTLKLVLWFTTYRYSGGTIYGYQVGEYTLGQLQGGYQFTNINVNVPYTSPPAGTYYVTMVVAEFQGQYVIDDYRNFPDTVVIGGGGIDPTIALYFPYASFAGGGWYWDNQIGFIYPYSNGVCYFYTYGHFYYPGGGRFDYPNGVYIWDYYYSSWTYTTKSVWPWVYYYSRGQWYSNSFF